MATPPPVAPRPNGQIAADILDLAFHLEDGSEVPRLGRFEGPVQVALRGEAPPGLDRELDALLARLRGEAGLDVTRAAGPEAEITVALVPDAAFAAVAPGAACFVVPGAASWEGFLAGRGTAAQDWDAPRRLAAAVFIPEGAAPQAMRDCLHEEVAQALGPPNDLDRLTDSVFDDDNLHGLLTGFDMLVLRALHDPSLRPGMTRAEVAARLPAVLTRLNPRGAAPAPSPEPKEPLPARDAGTAPAATMGADGPGGTALGRAAEGSSRVPGSDIRAAHDRLHLAALALRDGEAERALALARGVGPAALAHGDGALAGTLLLLEA